MLDETKKHGVPYALELTMWGTNPPQYCVKSEELPYAFATSFKSHSDAMKAFDRKVKEHAKDGARSYHHSQQICMKCTDGTILIGQWRYSSWCYSIAHADQKTLAGSCHLSVKTFEELCEQMTKHADQCYGGVLHSFQF